MFLFANPENTVDKAQDFTSEVDHHGHGGTQRLSRDSKNLNKGPEMITVQCMVNQTKLVHIAPNSTNPKFKIVHLCFSNGDKDCD